ncbi:MAG: radical SAM protein [Candidatus Aminicenantaceae bacterium]
MKASDIRHKVDLRPQKLSVRETPHLTIETNQSCNIRCRGCYNLYKKYVKPVAQIKGEIDLALTKRNLETITLLGGEPTLHPDLPEVISYVKSKSVVCVVLTNGVVFLDDDKGEGDRLLDEMIASGLDRIVLHVDAGQAHIHDDIDRVRIHIFEKFEKRKLAFALSTTVYMDSRGEIPELMRRYSRYRYFDGILSILEMDTPLNFIPAANPKPVPSLWDEYASISRELGIEPASYIPSSLDDDIISWLMFFYYINVRTGHTFYGSPEYSRIFRKVYRLFTGRHVFGITSSPAWLPLMFLLGSLVELILYPNKTRAWFRMVRNSRALKDLRFQYILLQDGPRFVPHKNSVQLCYHCPDATIRNGKLTPLCAADLINPMEISNNQKPVSWDLYYTVYHHMEEISSRPAALLRQSCRIPERQLKDEGVLEGGESQGRREEEAGLSQPPLH